MREWGFVLPLVLVFEALHKHCCSKGGIGIRPLCFSKEWLETPQSSSGLSGTGYPDSSKVFPRRDLCPPFQYLQRWLGSWFSYECVETTLLLPPSIPGCNVSIFLLLQEISWNILLTFFHCSESPDTVLTSWAPVIATLFPLPPLSSSRPVHDGRYPNTTPPAESPVQQDSSFRKLELLQTSDLSFSCHLFPVTSIHYIQNVPWVEEGPGSQMIAVADCSICWSLISVLAFGRSCGIDLLSSFASSKSCFRLTHEAKYPKGDLTWQTYVLMFYIMFDKKTSCHLLLVSWLDLQQIPILMANFFPAEDAEGVETSHIVWCLWTCYFLKCVQDFPASALSF